MATFDEGTCSSAHQALINNALSTIRNMLADWDLRCLTDLRDQLQSYVDCSLRIRCEDCDVSGQSVRGSDAITLCEDFLSSATQERINAVVFHEMVHAAGGTELDSEALENHFFSGAGATSPTSGDWPKFSADEGEFVIWDSATGELFELCMVDSWTISKGEKLTPVFVEPS